MRTLLIKVQRGEGRVMSSSVNDAIIKAVTGDARKALNMLEALMQLDEPTGEDVAELFGIVGEETVWEIMHGALKGSMKALDKANNLTKSGVSGQEIMNTIYFTALKGTAPGITEEKRLRVLKAMGTIPGQTDTMRMTSTIAAIILDAKGL